MVGSGEVLLILVVALILFGGKRLPEFAQSLGRGIREFKKACQSDEEIPVDSLSPHTAKPVAEHTEAPCEKRE